MHGNEGPSERREEAIGIGGAELGIILSQCLDSHSLQCRSPAYLGVMFLTLAIIGAGGFSVDALLSRHHNPSRATHSCGRMPRCCWVTGSTRSMGSPDSHDPLMASVSVRLGPSKYCMAVE